MPDRRLIEFARAMRREPAPAEEALWRLLRDRRLGGYKFRRQHPVGAYVADFYAASAALVVEADGDSHATEEGAEHDRVRPAHLEALGLAVLRFWNTDIADDPDGVLDRVCEVCARRQGVRRRLLPRAHPGGEG
ncbi:MAG: hypothetical protein C0501_09280 [Isosphaera sp.]|nr:hypothetical protein [Isosphaera sp.]